MDTGFCTMKTDLKSTAAGSAADRCSSPLQSVNVSREREGMVIGFCEDHHRSLKMNPSRSTTLKAAYSESFGIAGNIRSERYRA